MAEEDSLSLLRWVTPRPSSRPCRDRLPTHPDWGRCCPECTVSPSCWLPSRLARWCSSGGWTRSPRRWYRWDRPRGLKEVRKLFKKKSERKGNNREHHVEADNTLKALMADWIRLLTFIHCENVCATIPCCHDCDSCALGQNILLCFIFYPSEKTISWRLLFSFFLFFFLSSQVGLGLLFIRQILQRLGVTCNGGSHKNHDTPSQGSEIHS